MIQKEIIYQMIDLKNTGPYVRKLRSRTAHYERQPQGCPPPRRVVHLFAVLLPACQLAAVAPNALGLCALLQVLALHLPALPPPGVTLHSLPACHR